MEILGGGGVRVSLLKYTHWPDVFISVIDCCTSSVKKNYYCQVIAVQTRYDQDYVISL